MNSVEIKGKVVSFEEIESKSVLVKVTVEVTNNNRTDNIPVLAFNKLADVARYYTKENDIVTIKGAIRWNTVHNCIEIIAFNIHKVNATSDKKTHVVDKKVIIVEKDASKVVSTGKSDKKTDDKLVTFDKNSNGPIKKKDRFDGLIVNVYDNLSIAAKDNNVKKSDLKKAVESGKPFGGYIWCR